jgi:hypothetical protein
MTDIQRFYQQYKTYNSTNPNLTFTIVDASSINQLDATSTVPTLVPLPVKQQQDSEVVATSSVGPVQGNDTCRVRCPALPVLKEGKMIDVFCCPLSSAQPSWSCHEGQHLCDMPLDTSNTEVAKAPSQQQPVLLLFVLLHFYASLPITSIIK